MLAQLEKYYAKNGKWASEFVFALFYIFNKNIENKNL